jgi:cobalt/nickel transport system permease protein
LHHVTLDRWSRQRSPIHGLDARAKLAAALILLVAIGATPARAILSYAVFAAALIAALSIARLPLIAALARAAIVLPFSAIFAVSNWASGAPDQAIAIAVKSYLSALAALALIATTPLPVLLRAFEWFRVPGLLIMVAQFVYRYLFVVSEQAQHMRAAALCRGGRGMSRGVGLRSAAGAVAVLFARSQARAEGIHRAMASRGFNSRLPAPPLRGAGPAMDWLCIAASVAIAGAARAAPRLGL